MQMLEMVSGASSSTVSVPSKSYSVCSKLSTAVIKSHYVLVEHDATSMGFSACPSVTSPSGGGVK